MYSDFIANSNKYKDRKICRVHPTSVWGKDIKGDWYTRCAYGNKLNEDCTELVEEDPYVSKR